MTSGPSQRVAFFLPSLAGGGAERVTVNLAAGLSARGFPTDLVLARACGPYLTNVQPPVRVVDFAAPVLRSLPSLAGYLRRERPVVLLSALNHANLVAMMARTMSGSPTRVVIALHSLISRERQDAGDVRTRAVPVLLRHLHRMADGVVAVSDGVADDFARFANVHRKRITVIPNPVITSALIEASVRQPPHPWFDAGDPVVLGVGRFVPSKNFSCLIDAFALVRRRHPARLVLLGDGPERAALEARVRSLGIADSVAMPGFVDNPYAGMARAAVVALSSDYEGLPTVLIESLAVGTPVVATDCVSGPREILQGGALGRLVPQRDPAALADAIAETFAAKRVAPPWNALRQYTPEAVLDQYERALGLHA